MSEQSTPSDQDLEALFDEFFNEWFTWLSAIGRTNGLPNDAADNEAQETLLVFFEKASKEVIKCPEAYLWTVMRNRIRHFHRDRKRQMLISLDHDVPMIQSDTPDDELHCTLRREFQKMLDDPDPLINTAAKVLLKQWFEDKKFSQIATELGIKVGTVKSKAYFARNHLRAKFQRMLQY